LEIHCVTTPHEIIDSLVAFQTRYVKTREKLKKIYERQTERYKKEYDKYVRKELDGKLTPQDVPPVKPTLPADMNKTYDKYIKLYETTLVEALAISFDDFNRFFFDEWDFIRQWKSHIRRTRAGGTAAMLNMADMSELEEISAVYGA